MTNFTALYDACVLYPAPLRDLLIQLAADGLHRAKWSERIHEEWIKNALSNNPSLTREKLNFTKDLMNRAVLDCVVEGYEEIELALTLPDKNDRHVLAAAIISSSDVIVTFNLKDFPKEQTGKYAIEAQHPDIFLLHLIDLNLEKVLSSLRSIRRRLKKPPYNGIEYLGLLERQGLKDSVAVLRRHVNLI